MRRRDDDGAVILMGDFDGGLRCKSVADRDKVEGYL